VNQHENAGVTFTIWKEGADREKDMPVARLQAQNKGGKAEVQWRYRFDDFAFATKPNDFAIYFKECLNMPVDPAAFRYLIDDYTEKYENPEKAVAKFIFTCKSYRCEEQQSGVIEIGDDFKLTILDEYGKPAENAKYSMMSPDGQKSAETVGKKGKIEKKALIPGKHQIKIEFKQDT
jgi:hypothetical protein